MIKKKGKPKSKEVMVVRDHIRELQWRLLAVFALLTAAGVVSFFYYHQILDILRAPLNQELYYTTPVGSFAFIMRICLVGGMVVAIPAIIYNVLMFARPAFKKPLGRPAIMLITLFSLGLAALGVLFSYSVIIPGALHFFGGFSVDGLSALISGDSYLSFVINCLIIFILIFQLPLIITLIDHMKRLSMKKLFKAERWVILGSLIAALMVPFAMDLSVSLLISLPIILLYNLSILIVAVRHAISKKSKPAKESPLAITYKPTKPIEQPAAINPIKVKTAPVASQIKPRLATVPNTTEAIKPKVIRHTMDISSYPINGSGMIPKSEAKAKRTETVTLKQSTPEPSPAMRTLPRSASRLIVPERNQIATRLSQNQMIDYNSEAS
ncbi:twin-arginine translocase subunit TatC [Candidatus Saccharibacteria bacterium]|nr:twin-arginine translocase subunit TatC [Candidatus Saccharibacteria bacterium]